MLVYTWFATHTWLKASAALISGLACGAVIERSLPTPTTPTVLARQGEALRRQTDEIGLLPLVQRITHLSGAWMPLAETALFGSLTRGLLIHVARRTGFLLHRDYDSASAVSRFEPFLLAPILASITGDPKSIYISLGTLLGTGVMYLFDLMFGSGGTVGSSSGAGFLSIPRLPPAIELPFSVGLYALVFGLSGTWTPLFSGVAMGLLHLLSVAVTGHPISIVTPILRFLSPTSASARHFMWEHPYSSLMLGGMAFGAWVSSWFRGTRTIRLQHAKAKKVEKWGPSRNMEERIVLGSLGLLALIFVRVMD